MPDHCRIRRYPSFVVVDRMARGLYVRQEINKDDGGGSMSSRKVKTILVILLLFMVACDGFVMDCGGRGFGCW